MATKPRKMKANPGKKRHFRSAEDLADAIRGRLTASGGDAVSTAATDTPSPARAAVVSPVREPQQDPIISVRTGDVVEVPIQDAWRAACSEVLPEALNRTSLVRQDDAVLVVYVESAVWATRIRMAAPSLTRALQAKGLPQTTDLRIRVLPREHAPAEPEKRTASLTPGSAKVISGIATRMGNTELGDSLRRLARSRSATKESDE